MGHVQAWIIWHRMTLQWGTCLERSIDLMSRWLFVSFLCVLSLSSVFRSFIHMYCDTGSLWKCTPALEVKPLLFSRIPNISAVNILLKTGKIHGLIAFYKLFLSHIKVKILINSRRFLMVFLDVPSLWLIPPQFSVN